MEKLIEKFDELYCEGWSVNLDLIRKISKYLYSVIEENKNLRNYTEIIKCQNKKNKIFNSKEKEFDYPIKDYLINIQKFLEIKDYSLIYSLIYLDRLCENSSIILNEENLPKLYLTSILIANKINEDNLIDNYSFSDYIYITNKELNKLEYKFLVLVNFDLFVSRKEYEKYKTFINAIKI